MKQALLLSIEGVPASGMKMNCSAIWSQKQLNFSLFLSTSINKFMLFRKVDDLEFREVWRKYSQSVSKSDVIKVNEAVISGAEDFEKFFLNIVRLESEKDNQSRKNNEIVKYGGVFELGRSGATYALTINYFMPDQVMIRIATSSNNVNCSEYIIQSLVFLIGI